MIRQATRGIGRTKCLYIKGPIFFVLQKVVDLKTHWDGTALERGTRDASNKDRRRSKSRSRKSHVMPQDKLVNWGSYSESMLYLYPQTTNQVTDVI